ncbi:ribbon-helix-helix protein, CopG family [Methylobacterium sp. M6A4_1b]
MKAKDTKGSRTKPHSGIWKGNKRAISHTISPELLDRIDELAKRMGQTRTAIINFAIVRALDGDFFK